jgi:flagellar biogenesis protein FliO
MDRLPMRDNQMDVRDLLGLLAVLLLIIGRILVVIRILRPGKRDDLKKGGREWLDDTR